MLLYPRLPHAVARALAHERAALSPAELRSVSATSHPAALYNPTGGRRVRPGELARLQERLRQCAADAGFPRTPDASGRRAFDAGSAALLHDLMDIGPTEAAREGVWAFVGCVLLPDLVRWRFYRPDAATSPERFLGGARGLRNTFGRAWWRAWLLREPDARRPFGLLEQLSEDELVQITERPSLAGNPLLARQVCHAFLKAVDGVPELPRTAVLRDAMKRLRRLLPLVAFEMLDADELRSMLDELFADTIRALGVVPTVRPAATMVATPTVTPRAPARSTVTTVPTVQTRESDVAPVPLVTELARSGIEVIDRRPTGRLWVVGGAELEPVMDAAERTGWIFRFTPNGGAATGYRPGWYLLAASPGAAPKPLSARKTLLTTLRDHYPRQSGDRDQAGSRHQPAGGSDTDE